ncbi:hypothetical protein SCLCIDRAFT_1224911 [Scleroderma citrinum Foug A]|uniref:Uncharacterized protein n=1 Tax=Scleroderma citrinum Foug A TaxID=1036808 RepID=A0A0C2ZDF2_9AGAM|nr:hypothetical protein SCLCIDRAFT_1224911 [Scleroderma citrinum Foug A]
MCDTYTGITWYHGLVYGHAARFPMPYGVLTFQIVGAPINEHLTHRSSRDWAGHMSMHHQCFETRGYTAGVGRKDH